MKPISRYDVIEELDAVKTHDELIALIKKYPTRITANIDISVDCKPYNGNGNSIYFDGYTGNIIIE